MTENATAALRTPNTVWWNRDARRGGTPGSRRARAGIDQRSAHYVRKEKIVESAVTGHRLWRLCGKVWIPKPGPGQASPSARSARSIYESMMGGDGEGGGPDT